MMNLFSKSKIQFIFCSDMFSLSKSSICNKMTRLWFDYVIIYIQNMILWSIFDHKRSNQHGYNRSIHLSEVDTKIFYFQFSTFPQQQQQPQQFGQNPQQQQQFGQSQQTFQFQDFRNNPTFQQDFSLTRFPQVSRNDFQEKISFVLNHRHHHRIVNIFQIFAMAQLMKVRGLILMKKYERNLNK